MLLHGATILLQSAIVSTKVQQNGSIELPREKLQKMYEENPGEWTFVRLSARFELSEVNCTYFSASTVSPVVLFGIPPCRETKLWN